MSELYSPEAEQSVIGAAMLNNAIIPALANTLRPEDFFYAPNRSIWGAIAYLAGGNEACDIVTVSERLESGELLDECGGMAYLSEMCLNTPSASNAMAYANIVAELGQRRQIIATAYEMLDQARDKQLGINELIDGFQAKIGRVKRIGSEDDFRPVGEYLESEFLGPLDKRYNGEEESMGLSFGVKEIDEKTMGAQDGDLIVIAGRPSMGKTAFSLGPVEAAMLASKTVLYETLESKRSQIILRSMSRLGNVPMSALKDPRNTMTDDMWPRLTRPVNMMRDASAVYQENGRDLKGIRADAERMVEMYGSVGLIVVDHMGKAVLDDGGLRHDQKIGLFTAGLKQIAKEFNCPVFLLSQLNRSLEQRPNKRPVMGDLKNSSSIEEDADIIGFLYRDEVYNPDNQDNKGIAEFIIAKNRDGETGIVHMASRLNCMRFDDLAPKSMQEAYS